MHTQAFIRSLDNPRKSKRFTQSNLNIYAKKLLAKTWILSIELWIGKHLKSACPGNMLQAVELKLTESLRPQKPIQPMTLQWHRLHHSAPWRDSLTIPDAGVATDDIVAVLACSRPVCSSATVTAQQLLCCCSKMDASWQRQPVSTKHLVSWIMAALLFRQLSMQTLAKCYLTPFPPLRRQHPFKYSNCLFWMVCCYSRCC